MSPFIAELLGTMVMILLGDGVVANVVLKKTKGFQAGWITITTAWALAVFTGVVIAGPYSGAHLNPAITIGFAIAEKFPWASVGPYIIAQMLGAALGAFGGCGRHGSPCTCRMPLDCGAERIFDVVPQAGRRIASCIGRIGDWVCPIQPFGKSGADRTVWKVYHLWQG